MKPAYRFLPLVFLALPGCNTLEIRHDPSIREISRNAELRSQQQWANHWRQQQQQQPRQPATRYFPVYAPTAPIGAEYIPSRTVECVHMGNRTTCY
jgi:hypothetical protein